MEIYWHIVADTSQGIKDVLVSDSEKDAPEFDPRDYVSGQIFNIEVDGPIEIFGGDRLPDVIG